MKIVSTYLVVPAVLLAVALLASCDRNRGNNAGSAAETSAMTTTDATDAPTTAANQGQTSADAYSAAPAPVNAADSSPNPMHEMGDEAPRASDPGQAPMDPKQHTMQDRQDGAHGGGVRKDGARKPTP